MNSVASTWGNTNTYALWPVNLTSNTSWGVASVPISAPVIEDAAEFRFNVTAPSTPGTYNFQWMMAEKKIFFGQSSPAVSVSVYAASTTPPPPSGTTPSTPGETPSGPTPNNAGVLQAIMQLLLGDDDVVVPPPPPATLALAWLNAGSEVGVRTPVTFSATATGPAVTRVALYVDDSLAGYAAFNGTSWNFTWTAGAVATYQVVAKSLDANGKVMAQSAAIPITVMVSDPTGNGSVAPAALAPVNIDVPHLTNENAGTLPGELAVNSSGATIYNVPIVAPPGTAGWRQNSRCNTAARRRTVW